jgi:hypothetical protein
MHTTVMVQLTACRLQKCYSSNAPLDLLFTNDEVVNRSRGLSTFCLCCSTLTKENFCKFLRVLVFFMLILWTESQFLHALVWDCYHWFFIQFCNCYCWKTKCCRSVSFIVLYIICKSVMLLFLLCCWTLLFISFFVRTSKLFINQSLWHGDTGSGMLDNTKNN